MLLVIGKILEEKIECFVHRVLSFIYDTENFIKSVNTHIKSNEEWSKNMSELANQLVASVENFAKAQSAYSTSLGEYFAKVQILIEKNQDSDDDEIQAALKGIADATASVNTDSANLQSHQQALADATGTAAPTEPVPTPPGSEGTTPPVTDTPAPAEGGETGSSDSTPPADGESAPEGEAGSTGESGSSADAPAEGEAPVGE